MNRTRVVHVGRAAVRKVGRVAHDLTNTHLRFAGWRGVSLVGLAIFSLSRALIYLPPVADGREVPASIRTLTVGSPFTVTTWGILWAGATFFLVLAAFLPRSTWALGAYLGMTTAASVVYLGSWWLLFPPDNGEWSSGIMYLGLAVATFGLIKIDQRHAELYAALKGTEPGAAS